MHDYKGDILDNRYLVENRIGKGGMGVVYQGKHVVIGRKVAIKFLSAEYADSEEVVTRFYREAQTATQIGHKNIIEILDVGTSEQHEPFIVMEYLEGEDLGALLKRKKVLNLSAACGILEPVLSALSAAHEKGVVHRDLKPENIFLQHDPSSGEVTVKLIDFGISKLMTTAADKKLTLTGSALGTPHYMSPEQTSGSDEVDHRTDIYAMGVILFEMLTGETPYTAPSHQILMVKILTEAPREPYEINRDFPDEAYPIVQKALSREVADRYQSALEMLEALRSLSIYDERVTQLTACTSGIRERRAAMGDLGSGNLSGRAARASGPSRSLQEAARRGTLGGWAGSRPFPSGVRPPKRRARAALLVASAVLLLSAAGFILWNRLSEPTKEGTVVPPGTSFTTAVPAVTPPSLTTGKNGQSAAVENVRITLSGAPPNAEVRFGDEAVSADAFDTKAAKVARMLVVKSPGYEVFRKDIVPDHSQIVAVELIPMSNGAAAPDTEAAPGAAAPGTAALTTAPDKKPMNKPPKTNVGGQQNLQGKQPSEKDGFIQGRRKTEIAESFE